MAMAMTNCMMSPIDRAIGRRPSASQRDKIRTEILSRYPTEAQILDHADSITLDEFKCLGESIPKFAEGLFDEPSTAGGRRKRKRLSEFSEDEKQARRKLKNRVAAQSARDRKRKLNQDQCDELSAAKQEILALKNEIWQLRQENSSLRQENMQYRNERLSQSVSQPLPISAPLTISTISHSSSSSTPNAESSPVFVNPSNDSYVTISSGGVPLKTNFAPSAERPQSSFRAGTHQQLGDTLVRATVSKPSLSGRGKRAQNQLLTLKSISQTSQLTNSEIQDETAATTAPAKEASSRQPAEMSAFCMLFLQVILSRARDIIGKLDNQKEKQLNRRVYYAHEMKMFASGKKDHSLAEIIPRHTLRTAAQPVSMERKILLEIPSPMSSPNSNMARKRKLPLLEALAQPEQEKRLAARPKAQAARVLQVLKNTQPSLESQQLLEKTAAAVTLLEIATSTTCSPPSSKKSLTEPATQQFQHSISSILTAPKSTQNSSSSLQTWPMSSQTLAQSSALATLPRTKFLTSPPLKSQNSKSSAQSACPVHLERPEKTCLVCRAPTKEQVALKPEFLNKLNATDFILRQVHISRESQIAAAKAKHYQEKINLLNAAAKAKQHQEKINLLKEALRERLVRLPHDPRNPLIERALHSNCSLQLEQVAREVISSSQFQQPQGTPASC